VLYNLPIFTEIVCNKLAVCKRTEEYTHTTGSNARLKKEMVIYILTAVKFGDHVRQVIGSSNLISCAGRSKERKGRVHRIQLWDVTQKKEWEIQHQQSEVSNGIFFYYLQLTLDFKLLLRICDLPICLFK
jgi:hypothetical protein